MVGTILSRILGRNSLLLFLVLILTISKNSIAIRLPKVMSHCFLRWPIVFLVRTIFSLDPMLRWIQLVDRFSRWMREKVWKIWDWERKIARRYSVRTF